MRVTTLRVLHLRNHVRTELAPGPGVNVLVGANAQGKSTVLEAVQLAALGRSPRTKSDAELLQWGQPWARVRVQARRVDRDVDIDVGLRADLPGAGAGRAAKEFKVNGVPVRRGALFGHLLIVNVSPADDAVVTGAPVMRRRLVDLLLSQLSPAYYYTLQRYVRVVEQRNRLLRERRAADLGVWDEQAAVLGATISARRWEAMHRVAETAAGLYAQLTGGRETLKVEYAPHVFAGGEEDTFDRTMEAFRSFRSAELARGATLVGPHRDDLRLLLDGHDLRLFGSRGQQQMVMLAIRLAERQVLAEDAGEQPVLLLDDVLMVLDEQRQRYLLEHLADGQSFVTVTTPAVVLASPVGAAVFVVAGGTVTADHAHAS